ncbi:MAG: hypothetical protein QOJ64_3321 [Acidobacteriota bacterium]|jgi:hypothetical protein|nr:hypothetical protein [Acidobacteriota bacterium]
MHDCQRFKDGLVDLVFDAASDENRRHLAEVESCYRCRIQYRSITDALAAFDQAAEASLPDENYWTRQHEALRQSLVRANQHVGAPKVAFWKSGLAARISLPVPIAAAFAVTLIAVSIMALQHRVDNSSVGPAQAPSGTSVSTKAIEVPVIQERVVTRTVYVDRKLKVSGSGRRSLRAPAGEVRLITQANEQAPAGLFTNAALTDYQPPDEMRIRIVKRSNSDEN